MKTPIYDKETALKIELSIRDFFGDLRPAYDAKIRVGMILRKNHHSLREQLPHPRVFSRERTQNAPKNTFVRSLLSLRSFAAKKSSCLCSLAVVLLPLLGCQPEQSELPSFNGEHAYAEVEALVRFSPRDAGTSNGWKAAEHISQRLEGFGVEAETDTFVDMTPDGEKTMHNVVGRIPGTTDQWVILGSHFDTMPGIDNFQGANDSGSSTGILLELARMLGESGMVPDLGIIFAFFDGEEGIAGYIPGDGLHGSRHMAKQLAETGEYKNIKAMILLDMVGDTDLHFTIPYNSSREVVKEVLNAAHATGHRDRFSLSRSIITDDHVPFLKIGIPAIDIIDFKFGSEPGLNDYWHTAADNLENTRAGSLQITGEITLQLLSQLAFGVNAD